MLPMSPSRLLCLSAAAAAVACLPLAVSPAWAQVSAPSPGVVCDERGRVCYDRQGLSLALTQQYYGQIAAQNLLNQLAGSPAPTDFRLSNGAACSSAVRTCWSDGWGRRQVDATLSQQLYGGSGGGYNPGGGGYNPNNANNPNRIDQTDAGYCQLYRSGRRLFTGSCTLRKVSHTDKNRTRFDATLGNGSSYSFRQRDGVTVIQDASGNSWPVSASVQGRNVSFRWADMQLIATRTGANNAGSGSPLNEALGVGITNLLNSLFR
jgi:hypothetical protein